jgi:hypothetical protein
VAGLNLIKDGSGYQGRGRYQRDGVHLQTLGPTDNTPKAQLAQLHKPEAPATIVCFATINCTGN